MTGASAETAGGSGPRHGLINLLFLACALLLLAAFAVRMRSSFVDDAFIGFRYVQNCLTGHGLVFNPPERVEGVTNIGWLLLLVPIARVLDIQLAAKILGLLFSALAVVLSYATAARIAPPSHRQISILPVPLLIVASFDFVYFANAGMETGLLAALLCLIAYLAVSARHQVWLALLCAFAFLVHPEAVLIYPIAVALGCCFGKTNLRAQLVPALTFVGVVVLFTAARYAYWGALLPNTFAAKTETPSDLLSGIVYAILGSNTNVSLPLRGLLVVPLLVWGVASARRAAPLGAAFLGASVMAGAAFCLYAPEDWTLTGRYLAPYVPVTLTLVWIGLVESHFRLIGGRQGRRTALIVLLAYFAILTASGISNTVAQLGPSSLGAYPGYVVSSSSLVAPAKWMNEHLPSKCVIATRRIGVVSFYTRRTIFDYDFGLVDRQVARLIRASGHRFEMPTDPALATLWRQKAPDYLLEDLAVIEAIARKSGMTPARFRVHGLDYALIKTFPIGTEAQWALCARVE